MNRAILLGTAGAAVIAAALGLNYAIDREETAVPPPADVASTAPAPAEESGSETATAPAAQPEPGAATAPDAGQAAGPTPPQFDIVRVEPTGGTVIAGRAPPDSEVTVLLNGQPAGAVTADTRGEWVLLPDKPLPPGSHELSLSSVLGDAPPVASEEMVVVVVPEPNKDIAGRETGSTGQALALLVPRDGDGASTVLQVPPATGQPSTGGVPTSAATSPDEAPADPVGPGDAAAPADPAADGAAGEAVAGASGNATPSPDTAVPQTDADAAAALPEDAAAALAGTQADGAPAPESTASQTGTPAPASGETSGATGEVSAAPAPAAPSDTGSSSTAVAAASSPEVVTGAPAASGGSAAETSPASAQGGGEAQPVDGDAVQPAPAAPPADPGQPGVVASVVPETGEAAGATGAASTAPAEDGSGTQTAAAVEGDTAVVSGAAAAGQADGVSTTSAAEGPAAAASTSGYDPSVAAEGAIGAAAPLADGTAAAALDSSQTAAALPGTPVAAAAVALAATQSVGEGVTSGGLVLDSVDYDAAGNVVIGGRAEPGSILQVYLDNSLIGTAFALPTGRWHVKPEQTVDEGLHTLRVDQVHREGQVVARVESPFSRAEPVTALPGQTVVIVQPGNSLWRIARRSYGDGLRYAVLYQANRSQIANPDLIYPGQVFVVPNIVQN